MSNLCQNVLLSNICYMLTTVCMSQHNIAVTKAQHGLMGSRSAAASWGSIVRKSCTPCFTRLHDLSLQLQAVWCTACSHVTACLQKVSAVGSCCSPKDGSMHVGLSALCLLTVICPWSWPPLKMASKQMKSISSPWSGVPTGCALWWRIVTCHCFDATVVELQTQLAVRICWSHW